MRVNFSFGQTPDERLLVITETTSDNARPGSHGISATPYEDENVFLASVIFAELTPTETTELVVAVLLAMQGSEAGRWVRVDLTAKQLNELGLDGREGRLVSPTLLQLAGESGLTLSDRGWEEVLLRSPTPIAMSMGENHRVAFINDAYARILGREHGMDLLGIPVEEAFPELRGQSCVQSLDEVYRTGAPKIGIEVKGKLRPADSQPIEEAHFELSYNPIRNHRGMVCGVIVLATNITEMVLDRQVSASREAQLYRQWAELETIYRTAPLAMCYFDAKEYRIIRANKIQADTMGAPAEELVGKSVLEIFPDMVGLRQIFERVAQGERITNLEFTTDFPSAPGVFRNWRLNYSPVFDAFGNVEMITSIAMEITPNGTGKI